MVSTLTFWEGIGELAASVLTTLAVVIPVGIWAWRRFVRVLAEQVAEILAQVKGNGGNTTGTGDRLMRVEAGQRALLAAQGVTEAEVDAQMTDIHVESHARPTPTP